MVVKPVLRGNASLRPERPRRPRSSTIGNPLRKHSSIVLLLAFCAFFANGQAPAGAAGAPVAADKIVATAPPSLDNATIIEPPSAEPSGDSIAINFEGVDLMSLLRYLSQETGKGFILDQSLSGSITIISPVRLSRREALATLESILQVKGYAAIPSGKMYKIVPLAQAKVAGTETRRGDELPSLEEDDTLVTQIIPMQRTGIEEAKAILTPLLPPDASMLTFPPSNTLIITGRSVNIKRAVEVLDELEKGRVKPGLDIIALKFSTAPYLKGQLESIINGGGLARGELRGSVIFIADTRNNSLLVITAPENFRIIRDLIERLDTASSDTRPELTRFFQLRFADEVETVKQIQDILSLSRRKSDGGPVATETQAIDSTKMLPIKRTKSIMVSTRSPEILQRIAKLLVELDRKPLVETSNVQIVRLNHADCKVMAETLMRLVADKAKGKSTLKPDPISFVAEPSTNSLIVTGQPQIFAQYQPILKSLDVMRPQILVEALIAEVSGNLAKSIGIEWGVLDAAGSDWRAFGNTNFGLRSAALTGQGMQIGVVKDPLDLTKVKNGDFAEISKIKTLVNMYQNNAKFNILSAPRVLATDNEEAKIMVGEVVALPQGFTKDRDSGRFDLTNFKYEDVGINLTLTPRVNAKKAVTMKINQEVKKRQEENLYQFNVPVLTKRMMNTTVTVPNHETIVIGGLVREDKTEVEDRIPVFSSLPLIGKAFRNKRKTTQKTNLLVFLTPHILSTPEEVARFDLDRTASGDGSEIKPEVKEEVSRRMKAQELDRNPLAKPSAKSTVKPAPAASVKPASVVPPKPITGEDTLPLPTPGASLGSDAKTVPVHVSPTGDRRAEFRARALAAFKGLGTTAEPARPTKRVGAKKPAPEPVMDESDLPIVIPLPSEPAGSESTL